VFLAGIVSLKKAPKDVRIILISLIVILFGLVNAFVMNIKEKTLPLDVIDKEWDRYVDFCKQEHISWSDVTFPEWLSIEASE
jgi:hypothetical protein